MHYTLHLCKTQAAVSCLKLSCCPRAQSPESVLLCAAEIFFRGHLSPGYSMRLHHRDSWAWGEVSRRLTPESFCSDGEGEGDQSRHTCVLPRTDHHSKSFPSSETNLAPIPSITPF